VSSKAANATNSTPAPAGAAVEPALSVRNVSKRYPILSQQTELKTSILHPLRTFKLRTPRNFWGVRNVSFDVAPGEFFALVGANGSGKSTLLRIMAGLSRATEGSVVAHGSISTLLELGSGFHPQVSGRENVIVNGLLTGMTRAEITSLMPRIVEFAGLSEFIDQPMRTYSSGMYVRLGFAIAAMMEPEILLIDEVLAVGDARFQERCFEHIQRLRERGTTIVMVSHDLGSVEKLASRAALLERGRLVCIGAPSDVVAEHLERLAETSPEIQRSVDEAILQTTHEEMQERLERDPIAAGRFARALEDNPEFKALMDKKAGTKAAEADDAEPKR